MTEYKTVAELLEKPERWTYGVSARDADGNATSVSKGVCWCLEGAIWLIYPDDVDSITLKICNVLGCYPHQFNDTHTHAEVLEVVRKAGI